VIDALMAIAESCRALGTPSGLKEARFAYLEAARLQQSIAEDLARDREIIERELGGLQARERRGMAAGAAAPSQAQAEEGADAPYDFADELADDLAEDLAEDVAEDLADELG
jgi:hypothetical protein